MKTAVSMFSFAQDADLREKFALIRRAGYDGVEPVMSEAGYLTHLSSEAEIRKIGKIAADNGLEIPSVGVWSLWENNPWPLTRSRNACRTGTRSRPRRT